MLYLVGVQCVYSHKCKQRGKPSITDNKFPIPTDSAIVGNAIIAALGAEVYEMTAPTIIALNITGGRGAIHLLLTCAVTKPARRVASEPKTMSRMVTVGLKRLAIKHPTKRPHAVDGIT